MTKRLLTGRQTLNNQTECPGGSNCFALRKRTMFISRNDGRGSIDEFRERVSAVSACEANQIALYPVYRIIFPQSRGSSILVAMPHRGLDFSSFRSERRRSENAASPLNRLRNGSKPISPIQLKTHCAAILRPDRVFAYNVVRISIRPVRHTAAPADTRIESYRSTPVTIDHCSCKLSRLTLRPETLLATCNPIFTYY